MTERSTKSDIGCIEGKADDEEEHELRMDAEDGKWVKETRLQGGSASWGEWVALASIRTQSEEGNELARPRS